MKYPQIQHVGRQRGTVLVISLVFLLAMTLIGITAMQTTVLEERMTGNMRDQNLAFQAGEAGIREGLDWVETEIATAVGMPAAKSDGSTLLWLECAAAQTVDGDGNPVGCGDGSTAMNMTWLASNGEKFGVFTTGSADTALKQGADGGNNLNELPHSVVEERYVPPPEFEPAAKKKGVVHYTVTTVGFGGTGNARAEVQATVPALRL